MDEGTSLATEANRHAPPAEEGRWLVVGSQQAAEDIEAVVDRCIDSATTTRVPGYLAALGELASQPAEVVIGPVEAMEGMVQSTARSLRDLAPRARLVVVADDQRAAQARSAMRAGFDTWLTPPLDTRKILGVMQQDTPHDRSVAADASPRYPAAAANVAPTPPAAAARDTNDPVELGDVDLIESIFAGSGLREMAMQIVETRSGIKHIGWVRDNHPPPADHLTRRVAFRGREFGVLHAPPPADQTDLAGWAGWLARWVALDEQTRLLQDMSMRDALTGVWNRRYFDRFLNRILPWARRERTQVTLLVFDIDDFKRYNDRFGHGAGDEILKECSRLMQSVVREHDVVARIGGDEFAVIFWDADAPRQPHSRHPEDVRTAARRFQQAVHEHGPKLPHHAPEALTISGGLASYPWDGRTPQELLDKADEMALQSKRRGKNTIIFSPAAERAGTDS